MSLSSHIEWEAIGAGLVAGGFLVIGPFAGFVVSGILAGVFYIPLYVYSRRIAVPPIISLPIFGSALGLLVALICDKLLGKLIIQVYVIFISWGALGGFLFVYGADHRKLA